MTGRNQKRLAYTCLSTNSPSFRSSFPRCIRQSRGNRGQAGREGGHRHGEVDWVRGIPLRRSSCPGGGSGVGLGAPAQTGHHSRPQHPRARGERRRCPAPHGHVMRARGLELLQRAATERSSAGRSRRVLLLLRPPASCRRCSPLLAAPHPQPRRREEEETPLPAGSPPQPSTVPRGLSSRRGLHLFAPRWG